MRSCFATCVCTLLALSACEPSSESEARARKLFPDRSSVLSAERPFRLPKGAPAPTPLGNCPPMLDDVASGTALTLRGSSDVEERRGAGNAVTVTRWQYGYYDPVDPRAVGLATGEQYKVRCDRLAGIGVNVPDFRPGS